MLNLEKYLKSCGKKFFVDYFYIFKKKPDGTFDYFKKQIKENYTERSMVTKITCSKRIFAENKQVDALNIILNSRNVDADTRKRVSRILSRLK